MGWAGYNHPSGLGGLGVLNGLNNQLNLELNQLDQLDIAVALISSSETAGCVSAWLPGCRHMHQTVALGGLVVRVRVRVRLGLGWYGGNPVVWW